MRRERPGLDSPALPQIIGSTTDTDRIVAARAREGYLSAFLDGRERVLGRRLTLCLDPGIAAAQLSEHLGGDDRALAWLERVEESLR